MSEFSRVMSSAVYAMRWYVLLAVAYIALIFILPANQEALQTYNIEPIQYRLVLLLASLPSLFVWMAAFAGYAAVARYSDAIRTTNEGPHFRQLSIGVVWLAWSLPIVAFVSMVLNGIASLHPGMHSSAIIATNYAGLILPLIAFHILNQASRLLLKGANVNFSTSNARFVTALFVVAGIIYCYLTLQHFNANDLSSSDNAYFLPVWIMLITVIIPYLYSWFVGLLAAYQILLFGKHAQGLLYKRALLYVATGLIAVIVSSIAIQYTSAIIPRVGHVVIDYRLLLNTVLRIIGGVGFILLAIGCKRLQKIEEI